MMNKLVSLLAITISISLYSCQYNEVSSVIFYRLLQISFHTYN